jgi:hypothetical protein
MNQRLTEQHIRATCRELIGGTRRVTGRALRRELRTRFGAVGQTARVFQIWREEAAGDADPRTEIPAELQRRLQAAEELAAEQLARAERAEYRERAHQDKWAIEIDQLRTALRAQPNYAAEVRALQEQVLKLTVELHAAKTVAREKTPER